MFDVEPMHANTLQEWKPSSCSDAATRFAVCLAECPPCRPRTHADRRSVTTGLSQHQLADVALDLLQDVGLNGLNTRHLAARLGHRSSVLSRYVQNDTQLLAMVADCICAQMPLPDRDRPLRDRLEAIAWEFRRVLIGYRDATRLFAEPLPRGAYRIRLFDTVAAALIDAGLPLSESVSMAAFYLKFVLGMVSADDYPTREARDNAFATHPELWRADNPSQKYPHLRGAEQLLSIIDPADLFRSGLKTLLDGLDSRIAALRAEQAAFVTHEHAVSAYLESVRGAVTEQA